MEFNKNFVLYLLLICFGLFFYLYKIFILRYYQNFVSKALQILFLIIFVFMTLFYIFLFIILIPIKINFINEFKCKLKKNILESLIIIIITNLLWIFELIIICLYFKEVEYYCKNCPFFLKDELNKHYKRRCELYNINENSRYSNQYICSYDPTKDFKYKKVKIGNNYYNVEKKISKKIEDDFLICVKLNHEIYDNLIISSFCEEYNDIDKYYCSRTNQPKKFDKIDDKNCKNKSIYSGIITILIIVILELPYLIYAPIAIFEYTYYEFNNSIQHSSNQNNNANVDVNVNNKSNSTIDSDNKKNEIEYQKKKTVNIGLDKNGEFSIEKNLKDLQNEQQSNRNNNNNINN